MTVLEKKAASGVDGRKLGQYLAVAMLAGAIGVGSALGIGALIGDDAFGPAQIEQARGVALADHLQNQWIAQINSTRAAELIEFYRAPFMARVAEIDELRAAQMVEHYSNLHKGQLARINEQRADDMVQFRYGAGR